MIDDQALVALLQEEERLATSFRTTELADEQEAALDYYEARPFGDEEEGRSQVVTPDVAEVVDYMTVSVLRTCVSGDRVVEFEAKEEQDEEAAADATEAVNYVFMRGQDGYKVLTDWLQSGLIEKIGVVKTMAVEDVKRRRERLADVDEDTLAALMEEPGLKVLAATPDEATGLYTIEVESSRPVKRYVDMPVPSEEFIFSARCRDIDDAGYKAHRCIKTVSELIEMGFDREQVEALPEEGAIDDLDGRARSRWKDEGIVPDTAVPGMRKVWLFEEYLNIDLNGDGIAELVQVFRVNNTLLSVQEVEDNPFVVFCPFPRAHRMVGNSLAEKVMDIQRVRSVIMRQTLDGIYMTNNPRMWLPDECVTEATIDDLLTVRPGGIVRGKGSGGQPTPLYEPFDVQRGMAMMELLVGERESRTGITRLNQGLDADALNKTATGTAMMQAQGQQIEEFIARNFAEAMARLFRKKLKLMIAAGDPIAVKVEGGYRTVDPKTWSDDLDVSIRVGLGSGRKEQRLAYRTQLLQMQQLGLQNGMITPKHLWRNMAGWIRDAALGTPTDFWMDPEAEGMPQQPEQPDPKALEVQRKAQADQVNAQVKLQTEQMKTQQRQEEAEMKAQLEMRRQDMEAQLSREEMMADLAAGAAKANRPGGSLAS